MSANDVLSPVLEPQVSKWCSQCGPDDEATDATHPGMPSFVTILMDVSYNVVTDSLAPLMNVAVSHLKWLSATNQ